MTRLPPVPARDLDPDILQFTQRTAQRWREHPPLDTVSYPQARRIADIVREPWTRGGPVMARTEERQVATPHGSVRVRILDPGGEGLRPALIYLHGGGWTFFSIDTHDRVMREYAGRAGIVVVAVDYSLSPEHRFPRALDETLAVVRWLRTQGGTLGIDPNRLALGGDSAGAAMTISTCLMLRDAGEADALKAMLLNYGAYDPACDNESHRRYVVGGFMWDPGEMSAFWRNYLGATPPTNALACPIHADVHGLPPAFSAVPDCDVMFEEALLMAEKLRAAGVRSDVAIYAGATHGFLEAVSIAGIASRGFDDATHWLRDRLAVRASP